MNEQTTGLDEPSPKSPKSTDKIIGAMIRSARKELKLSQTELAEKLGITFQQVQKYERGVNRISASRLFEICETLDKPIHYFFSAGQLSEEIDQDEDQPEDLIDTKIYARMVTALGKFKSEDRRRVALETLERLAALEEID